VRVVSTSRPWLGASRRSSEGSASRRSGRRDAPGLWIDPRRGNRLAKICAFGGTAAPRDDPRVRAERHETARQAFDLIVPCGAARRRRDLDGALTDESPALAALAPLAAEALAHAFGVYIERTRRDR